MYLIIPTLIMMMMRRAVTAGERLLEALEIFSSERERLNQQSSKAEGIATQPNPLLLGLSPIPYLLRALQKIGQANLEQALLVLPFSKVSLVIFLVIS